MSTDRQTDHRPSHLWPFYCSWQTAMIVPPLKGRIKFFRRCFKKCYLSTSTGHLCNDCSSLVGEKTKKDADAKPNWVASGADRTHWPPILTASMSLSSSSSSYHHHHHVHTIVFMVCRKGTLCTIILPRLPFGIIWTQKRHFHCVIITSIRLKRQ